MYLEGTTTAVCIRQRWVDFFEHRKDGYYLEIQHSGGSAQGFIAGLTLPEEYRKRIIMVTIAGEVAIPDGLFKRVYNYRSTHDVVPHFQKVLGNFSTKSAEVTVLKRHPDARFFDHSYASPTYEERLIDHMSNFIEGAYDN